MARTVRAQERKDCGFRGQDGSGTIFLGGSTMLVLSRKVGESVMVGNSVKIEVVEIRGDKIRLGFTAPRDVSIHRQEVFDLIQRNESGDFPQC